jgi:hypothetical protein
LQVLFRFRRNVWTLECTFADLRRNDAETRDRTGDLQIFSLTLSQLSYLGLKHLFEQKQNNRVDVEPTFFFRSHFNTSSIEVVFIANFSWRVDAEPARKGVAGLRADVEPAPRMALWLTLSQLRYLGLQYIFQNKHPNAPM